MKKNSPIPAALASLALASCNTTAPVGNVEGLERQTPVTQDPNAIGDALNARNAVDYSNGGSNRRWGY